ncbi:hypothetical protein NIES4074_24030 [Cylindrospermum sp. NIES-4074]|nr:hypothetical protein NIES4074_24030 [Cylindrospermum sp. NIES-4074]
MIINYDYLGRPAELFILLDAVRYQLPFNLSTKQIDWDLIDYEPTKVLLQHAWNDWIIGKDMAFELRVLPSQDEPFRPENWEGWNRFMFQNAAYSRMVENAKNQRAISRLEDLAIRRFFQSEMILFWNSFLTSVPIEYKPTPKEIEEWRNAVDIYSMLFSFDDDGLMILR